MAVDADPASGELSSPSSVLAEERGVGECRAPKETASDDIADDEEGAGHSADAQHDAVKPRSRARNRLPALRVALATLSMIVVAMAALTGWLGFRAYQSHHSHQQRNLFLEAGRQCALKLTTISYADIDADVQRILDSATGGFYEDFQQRSSSFIDVVRQTQATTQGTITETGLESAQGEQAKVLVTVSVKTSNSAAPEQPPRLWRMRIGVQKVGDAAKASDVAFVP